MTTEPLPAIEPVTDEDVLAAVNLPRRALEPQTKHILEQDRRRVVERQANHGTTHAEGCVSWGRGHYECAMVEIERLRAEVARLTAACAAKDAALIKAQADLREVGNDYPGSSCYEWCHARADEISAALSTDAGKGLVDASGAVEAEVPTVVQDNLDGTGTIKLSYRGVLSRVEAMIGKRVLIMLKPEAP